MVVNLVTLASRFPKYIFFTLARISSAQASFEFYSQKLENNVPDHLTEGAELAVGATNAIVAADQLLQATEEEDRKSHLVKAGIGAAIAVGALELLRRQNEKEDREPRKPRRSGSYERFRSRSPSASYSRSRSGSDSGDRSRSRSSHVKHHKRHVVEEIIGAYSLGKEMLGDHKHHVAHLVGEALGAAGVYQELRARDKREIRI